VVIRQLSWINLLTLCVYMIYIATPIAQETAIIAENVQQDVVSYPAEFFSRYQPDSALDMLEQLPGFRMAFSGELRGYGSSPGNVLIDGRRPSSKRVTVPSILDRIPASQVDRIELIRGPVRNIELLGEPQVANVVLLTDTPAAVRWSVLGYRNSDMEPLPWFTNISLSDRWAAIDYNAGLDIFRKAFSERNDERILDGNDNLIERRMEKGYDKELEANFDLTASTWIGETLLNWNSQFGIQDGRRKFDSRRSPSDPGEIDQNDLTEGESDEFQFEAGITAERSLTRDLAGNLLLFLSRENENESTTQRSINTFRIQTSERLKIEKQIEQEAIVRTEFDWTGWSAHSIRLNIEGSYNLVDNIESETEDTGAGMIEIITPGATTKIEEYRGDFLIKDIWILGKLELDYGLGFEISRLAQTGEEDVERNLSYLKPHAEFSYSPSADKKLRIRVAREVAQLLFDDFISASLYLDEYVALGNPNLRPEATWVSDLGYEQRFWQQSVFKLNLFHHWITDVQDLIPITQTGSAPGNIGNGRRWGVGIEGAFELDWLGLQNARLDLNARWQGSSVTDPITGDKRVLTATILADGNPRSIFTNDNEYVFVVDYRQDFDNLRVAWGWDLSVEADLPVFKINEFDIWDKEPAVNFFVETTRWFGIKVRMELNNILDRSKDRERVFYTGQRDLSPVLRRQIQKRTDGREIGLSLSGSF